MAVTPQVVNGWTLYPHPLFSAQYDALAQRVMQLQEKDPIGYIKKNETKRFAAIHKLIFEVIPEDPTLADYRQSSTLGDKYKHWFRAKFFQQYKLFFRFHKPSKTIVYGWAKQDRTAGSQLVEVETWKSTGLPFMDDGTSSSRQTGRQAGRQGNCSKTDAYRVFGKMLKSGHPPDDWDTLLTEAKKHLKQH